MTYKVLLMAEPTSLSADGAGDNDAKFCQFIFAPLRVSLRLCVNGFTTGPSSSLDHDVSPSLKL